MRLALRLGLLTVLGAITVAGFAVVPVAAAGR